MYPVPSNLGIGVSYYVPRATSVDYIGLHLNMSCSQLMSIGSDSPIYRRVDMMGVQHPRHLDLLPDSSRIY